MPQKFIKGVRSPRGHEDELAEMTTYMVEQMLVSLKIKRYWGYNKALLRNSQISKWATMQVFLQD